MSRHWRRIVPLFVLVSLVVPGSVPAQPRALAGPIFFDGFESGNLSNWTKATAGFAAQQQVVFDGSWAGRATTTGPAVDVYKALPSAQSDLYADVHVKLISGRGTVHSLRFVTATGMPVVGLAMKPSGQLILRDFITKTSVTSTITATPASWHDFQLHATVNGAASTAEVWLDGAKVTSLSGTYSLGSAPVGRLLLGTPGSSSGFDMAFDDAIADTSLIGGPHLRTRLLPQSRPD